MDTQTPETNETAPTSRRALIASLVGAGAAVVAAGRVSASGAASASTATTVAPPQRSDADTETLNGILAMEKDMVATYAAAKANTSGDDLAALSLIESHHLAYVQALEGYMGRAAVAGAGNAVALQGSGYSGLAVELAAEEARCVQAHVAALTRLQGVDAASLVASIITVEARHRAALLVSAAGTVNALAGN